MNERAKNLSFEADEDSGSSEIKRFKELALRYQEIGAQFGVNIYPYRSPEMPFFAKATSEERKKATDLLELIVSIHEETLAATEAPINTRQLIWRALRRLSLIPGSDVFERLTDEDVVVIYDENQQSIFWNLQFFRFSSFSVEEMFFVPWFKFTQRDPAIKDQLYKMAVDVITGKITGTFIPEAPPHEVQEIDSIECLKTEMSFPFGSVLTKDGRFGGILMVQKMKILS